jgi:hypothetical protein
MSSRQKQPMWSFISRLALALVACTALAQASATLLLEEPYGTLGFFTATGHAAVYLSGVCAQTAIVLRKCAPGETGVVLSRYDGVGGYDWVAVPLIPYLYAVERPEDLPLFADAKMVSFLRDRYRRQYLQDIAPDAKDGQAPGGNWYELVGSSYDRTIYGFEIETTREQDETLIRKLNASPNESHFHLVSRNCADFAKDVLNTYFPRALHRSIVADVGMTTPKQMAKLLTRYSAHHPDLRFSRLVIAQVPGGMPRSTPVHGVVESFLKSKKYIVPSVVVSPIFAGVVAAAYVGTGAGHFEPGRGAMVYVVGEDPQAPLGKEDRRAYQVELKHLLAGAYPDKSHQNADRTWEHLQSRSKVDVDEQGRPVLEMEVGGNPVQVGDSAENILNGSAPPQLVRQLLEARLQSELKNGSARGLTEVEIARDWKLLQQTLPENDEHLTARSASRPENVRGNKP